MCFNFLFIGMRKEKKMKEKRKENSQLQNRDCCFIRVRRVLINLYMNNY
jgi:hypothetical protein